MGHVDDMREQIRGLEDPFALLEGIFAHAPFAVQIYRANGHCVLVNPAFRKLFGSEPPPEYNILRDEIAEANGLLGLIHRAFAGETISTPPIWYDPRELKQVPVTEGRRAAFCSTFFPLHARDGRVTHVAIVFEDYTAELTHREETEAARAAAEASARRAHLLATAGQLLATSLDCGQTLQTVAQLAVPDFADFCLVDLVEPDGRVSRAASAHADPGKKVLLDELCRSYPPSPDSPQPAARALREGRAILNADLDDAQLVASTVDDVHRALVQKLALSSHIAAPLTARGRTLGAMSFGASSRRYAAADVEFAEELASRAAMAIDNARLFAQTEAARRESEEANRTKDQFLAMLGHELRNPLAPIATAIELIRLRDRARGGEPTAKREIDVIERQMLHLVRLVDDLLDVSRITRGKVDLRRTEVRLLDATAKAVEMTSPLLEARRHQLTVDVPPDIIISGDEARIAQMLANLLANAAKYTDPGGRIRVSAAPESGHAVLRVVDNGRGIEPEMLPQIFDLFVQGRRTPDRAEGGLGLGLALVRALAAVHGGTVEARSAGSGLGSEFELRLPLSTGATEELAPASERAPITGAGRILVVDDNRDAAMLLGDMLSSVGHVVATAHDGAEALAVVHAFHPDVAVLDIGLPVMDGYELGRRLHEEFSPALRLVAVTGYGQEGDRERSRDAGFAAHLVKPVDPAALLDAVSERVSSG